MRKTCHNQGFASGFFVLCLLVVAFFSSAQEATQAPSSDACPGRPDIVVSEAQAESAEMPRELLCVIANTWMASHSPSKNESIDLLKRVLRQPPYDHLSPAQYIDVMQEAVRLWPASRYAHQGLAEALLGGESHQDSAQKIARARAAKEFMLAAELAPKTERARLIALAAEQFAEIKDKEGIVSLAGPIFGSAEDDYISVLALAKACFRLKMDQAETLIQKALRLRPAGTWEAFELYVEFLFQENRPKDVLDLLTPELGQQMPPPFFHGNRCKALERLGRPNEAKGECSQAAEPPPVGTPALSESDVHLLSHTGSDDCRDVSASNKCRIHPNDPNPPGAKWCWNYLVWNLAELMINEAGGEATGARLTVGWTVRDRALRQSAPVCGQFSGSSGNCTSHCPTSWDPLLCAAQKQYCCVIHSNQFVDSHRDISWTDLYLAGELVNGWYADPFSLYIPSGAQTCHPLECA